MTLQISSSIPRERLEYAVRAALELRRRQSRKACTESLIEFHRQAWPHIDPAPYSDNWHLHAIAEHLEAVTYGQIPRLIISIPPRCSKSLMVSVSWLAWTWAQQPNPDYPLAGPAVSMLCASYAQTLSERDSLKTHRLIESPWYQERWGKNFSFMADKDTVRKFENNKGGYRLATSVGGSLTGEGASILSVDDSINAKEANYSTIRDAANRWWDESMSTRLNDQVNGAKVLTMQRLHEDDLVGHILDRAKDEDWCRLIIPMEFEGDWRGPTTIGWTDPRQFESELLWPDRFPREVVDRLKRELGPYASAAQLQQQPSPRAGGIIQRDWWQLWPAPGYEPPLGQKAQYPATSLRIGSVDTAYGDKDENAWNAMTVWGIWQDERERPKVVMMDAWRMRGPLRGVIPPECKTDEERRPHWGLSEKIADTIRRRQLDIVLIEDKTRGKDLSHEIMRLLNAGECQIILINPQGDKVARLHACQAMFADKMIYAPDTVWAEQVITEVAQFPKSKFADYTDTVSMALQYMRNTGILQMGTEADEDNIRRNTFVPKRQSFYDV